MDKTKPRRSRLTLIKRVDPRAPKSVKIRHVFRELKKRCKDTHWWKRESLRYFLEFYYKQLRTNNGIYVVDEEWDNLILLDACRYDVLKEVLGRDIDHRLSRGSTTLEWFRENFIDSRYDDIVYVTANPWVSKVAGNMFHKVVPVWKDGWDEDLNTVHPKTTTEYAQKAAKRYPGKRLIVHYLQPHTPYIVKNNLPKTPTKRLEKGQLDPLEVWGLYKRSLEVTMPYVYELTDSLNGRTIVSADHGELFGKKILSLSFAGHPWGIRVPELIKVPWVVFDSGPRDLREEESERQKIGLRVGKLKSTGRI
jgi:hypothetical protein